MSSIPAPVVRSFIICEDITTDLQNPRRVTPVNVLSTIPSSAEPPYPYSHPQLCVYIQLIECRGSGSVRVEIREADMEEAKAVYRSESYSVSFPNRPLDVYSLRFRIRNCEFPAPGSYWVQVWYNDKLLGQLLLDLR